MALLSLLSSLSFVLLVNGGLSALLNGHFHEGGSAVTYTFDIYETLHNARSCAQCAALCANKRVIKPTCLAFSCHPLNKTCDFYAKGSDAMSPPVPGVQVFFLKIKDIFHVISLRGHLFSIYLSSLEKTYYQARDFCQALGAYLFEFDSEDDYEALSMITSGVPGWGFVGANDIANEGTWVTEREGAPLDTIWRWLPTQPTNSGGNENCAAIVYKRAEMNDVMCTSLTTFLCKKATT